MKVDTSRLKKGTSEVPPECQNLIDKLKSCNRNELIEELAKIETWTFGKCELFHWIDILDIFDEILEEATHYDEHPIYITCDTSQFEKGRKLLLLVLNFTTLLIEHSFSRHLYNSVEHLTQLLLSTDLEIILGVLNLLYMFSKRSNFISRLSSHKKNTLLNRLRHIAEPYGGRECGFGLADCCRPDQKMPKAIYHFYYEYYTKTGALQVIDHQNISKHDPKSITVKLWKDLDQHLDDDQKYHLFARARLATGFWNYENRILFVQARLQALSILVYSDALMGYTPTLIYPGFLEELVELLELQQLNLVEIRAAALRTLTAIIHLERNSQYQRKSESRLNTIIEVTGASSYHGFLPTLVRNCIVNLTGTNNKSTTPTTPSYSAEQQKSTSNDDNLFPLQLATALFSFLYHLASYEPGAESLVSCGMMESLLRVINWSGSELEHITFVTRAVRVIDLITNLDMQSFQTNYGLNTFIKRLNMEVNLCRKEQSYEIKPNIENPAEHDKNITHIDEAMDTGSQYGDDDICMSASTSANLGMTTSTQSIEGSGTSALSNKTSEQQLITNKTCLPQRAALLKSMLNFLKKAIQDIAFSDSIRHIMEATLPESLKHIISNSEYYGPSLFLLATDVVTVYVFQEPSLLSSLQDNGLTDVVLQALLKKDVPATREVLGSLPNVFSALCLNTRGMESFLKYNPFDKLFRVFISPVYLSAMRRRRSSDPLGDTASNIGNAMDELMRNQPSLKTPAIKAIIKLLEEIVDLGTDPKYVCWRAQNKNDVSPQMPNSRQTNSNHNNGGSSDEDEDDEEEVSTSSHNQAQGQTTAAGNEETNSNQAQPQPGTSHSTSQASSPTERIPIALIDYILNTMKFLEAILSNNSTDDHCREFVNLGGLKSLLSCLALPNLPVTSLNSPITATAQAVASVCKSILNLTHEPQVLQVALEQLSLVVENLQSLMNTQEHTSSSVLLKELANCQDINHAFTNANYTPLLHAMSAVHGYVLMLVHVCRSGQSDIRTLSLIKWGQDNETGIKLLKKLVMLYTGLVWESTLLLALCTDDIVPAGSEFSKDEMEKLGASDVKNVIEVNWDEIVTNLAVMENLTPIPNSSSMDVDGSSSTGALRKIKQPESNVKFVTSQSQLKYIKSLLGASSRLGRALAELFGLLVRLCVGSPLRQRRGQNFIPATSFTSPTAREIARILSFILVDGLSFQKLPASPVPKLKLTFLICSIGFTSPMLFDEKRFAYHLMLHKFIEEGGLEAYFEMFRWTLTAGYTIPIHRAIEHPNLPDGTGEALDAWLMLLEKMTNLKYIIESPHQITSKNRTGKPDFDTKHYLTYIHRNAFLAIQHIWGFKPLKSYGLRMTESMLSILKHIIKGEKVLQSKYYKNGQGVSISLDNKSKSILPGTDTAAAATDVNQEHLRQLVDMGFSREQSVYALQRYLSLEGATEYLLTSPRNRSILFDVVSDDERSVVANSNPVPINMDIDVGEEDEHVIRAILNSLGNERVAPTTSSANSMEISPGTSKNTSEGSKDDKTKAGESSKNRQKEIMKKYLIEQPLPKKTIDDFTSNLLKTCLNILDQLPETVYKICDLLITVTKRNGPIWRDEMLDTLCKEIFNCIQFLIGILVDDGTKNYKEKSEKLVSGEMANKTAVRIHLFTLFFQGQYQDMKVPCANALNSYNIIPRLIKVLTDYQMIVTMMNKALPTPKWLAPLALLLDLYDKVALSTKQKQQMHKICTQQWQWYDISSSKWTNYLPQQNKLINDAYMAGESELQLMVGRHRYTINFKSMSQINDESSNHRPIIMALRSIETMNNPSNAFDEKAEDAEQQQASGNDTIVASSSIATTISNASSAVSAVQTVQPTTSEAAAESVNLMDVDTPAKNYIKMLEEIELEPLSSFVPEEIVSSCVQLMAHQQLDRDTLHAIMRVLVRLTKNYTLAEVFARFGGIDVLLNMKQNSGFIGFTTLATLLIRHVIEEPKTLSLAIQNVLVNRTLVTIPPGHRELVFLVRQLNSAVYRDPELFKEAALKILRVDFDSMKRSQIPDEKRFIMRSLPLSTNIKYNMEQSTAMSAVCKLLKALIEPDEPGSNNMMWMQADKSKEMQGAIRKEKFTAEPQPPQISQSTSDDQKEKQGGSMNDKPLLNKSAILKILAESVKSYQTVALHITEHLYRAGSSTLITEDTSALSFILDKMFHISDANMDRECPTMAQSLISAIASSDVTQAQETVVHEVKMALQRALNEPETTEKHLHIEGLATLIPAMIDSNNTGNTEGNQFFKSTGQSQVRHNIFYIMVEKGIITDIARAAQYLELGGPNTIATLNHLMKPLEMLLRLTNEPMPSLPSSSKFKKMPTTQRRSQTAQSESDGNLPPPIIEQETSNPAAEQQNNQTNSEALSNNVNATMTTVSVSAGTSNNPIINQTRSTATNSDSTNAQDEQMLADDSEQNTDRDTSSAAIDSLVGENDLGDHIGEVHLNEILDTLISEELRGINEYAEDANQDDNNDEEEGDRHRLIRDNVELMHVLGEESSSDSDDSESNASDNEEREMDEVEEIENDEDEEEENEERSELDDDEETQPFEMYDRHSMYGRHLSPSIPEIERDHEDILMIQYSNNAQNTANANNNTENRENRVVRDRDSQIGGNINISVTNNEPNANIVNEQPQNFLFNANFPLLYNENSEPGVNDNSNPGVQGVQSTSTNDTTSATINTNAPPPNNHPLLSGRPDGVSADRVDDRLHVGEGLQTARRSNRTRTRYQFINVNTRNQPIILQRMLELRHNRQAGQNAGNDPFLFRDGTRVVVMDNGFSIFSNGDDLDLEMVDQSGYWFGRTLANHLNNHPSALSWWQEENKISGPDSNSDLCMVICDEMIPEIDAARSAELSKMRGKRKKKLLEEEEAKQRNQDGKKTNDEETAEIHVQPEIALSSVLTSNVPVPIEPIRLAEPIPNNEFNENLSNQNDQQQQSLLSNASSTQNNALSSNNLNISFMDVNESEQNNANVIPQVIQPITISTQIVSPPQHITTDNQLNLDLDVEMASDNEESSASANNSRSFSPNYSPNSNQIETGELNMLNRETSASTASNEQQNQVSNMNIQDQNQQSHTTQQMEQDHPMADSENGEPINSMSIEASQIPLPIDDSDDTDSGDDSDDDDDKPIEQSVSNDQDEAAAVAASTEQLENVDEEEDEAAGPTIMVQNIDPAIRAVLGDMEVPEGVDPSFLAALPPELRDEVVQEHIRQQRIRQRAQASVALQEAQAMADVNPEFLAALPLNIQEEVLAQQRIEQQRQAAAAANPNDPVNAAEFFQNLQPSLRQAILTDMEDSQISALPPDLAAEAQTLRRDWETRNRQMQERILSSSFTNALRTPGNRNPRVFVPRQHLLGFGTTGTHTMALTRNHPLTQTSLTSNMERQGAPLLDQESLASILVLLFIDDPNIGTLRLYRVIRNLCFHIPTRKWIIKSLLSIIMRCNEESMEHYLEPITSRKSNRDDDKVKWLKLRLDSALGGRANVFLKKLEKVGSNNGPLTIHPKASPTVCRHTLDLLIFLAKTFPIHFLPPSKKHGGNSSNSSNETSDSMPSTSAQALQRDRSTDFWDILLRLDNEIDDRSKKGAKIRSACKQIKEFCEQDIKTFAESPFGQLITMLSYDIIRKNTMLTDKLLRLLSLISIILADDKYKNNNLSKPPQQQIQQPQSDGSNTMPSTSSSAEKPSNEVAKASPQDNNNDLRERLPESERHLALTVDVLTSKSCSEDGLEDATSLLINLSQCSSMTKYMIIKLLVKGVIDLSHMVQKHINNLMVELRELNETIKNDKLKPDANNDDSDELSKPSTSKGMLKDRFTKDAVIITAPSKVKTSNDLQLPSMAPLLSKTSNQSFFLRILKVITQIRDTVRQDSKVCDADVEQQLVKLETVPLSELLDLDSLWNTLSDCLKELEETQDHHAVLVLQPTVEAFFIVHSAPQVKNTATERNLAARTIRNAGIAANQEAPQRDNNATAENANNNQQASEERSNQENIAEQQPTQQVHLNIPIDETAAAAAESNNSEAGTSHERLSPMDTTQSSDGSIQASTAGLQQQVSQQNLTTDQKKFLHFAETHRVVLNQILRQSSVHLADGPFAVLVDHTRVLDFDVKRRYFRIELERLDDGVRREEVAVHVHRANVFEDSFRELYRRSPEEWKNRFYIVFEDEEGQDAGGLLREWYMIISREIFNPMYALFTVSPGDRVTYMINPSSHCNPNHLCYFKFVGRVIAKAIYDNKLLECYFTRAFYKHILGIQVKYTDMESEDYAFYQGLVYLIENHVESLGYDLTFSLEIQEFGVTEVRELKANGCNMAVTEENKLEYIQLVCQLKMSGSIKQQLNAFLEGFYDIIPKRLISIFNEQELELLISGLPNIDIEDLRANTEYHKYQATSIQIQWFWRALRSFDQAERAKFLQFVTGTSKVPLQGFGALEGMNGIQKFQIHRDDRSTDRLPSAHTCFNQLDLPVYKSYDKLRTNLLKAIHECSEGFGFA